MTVIDKIKNFQKEKPKMFWGLVAFGVFCIIVGIVYGTSKSDESNSSSENNTSSPTTMANLNSSGSTRKYIPLVDSNGNMYTGTFQDLLNLMAETNEPVVFPSNVTFTKGANVEGGVNFKNPVEFKNGMTVHGKTTIHGTHVVEGLSMSHHIKTNSVSSHGPNLRLKGKAITLLSDKQNLGKPIEGRNIMLQTISSDRKDNDGFWDRVFIPKKTGIGYLNNNSRDSIQVGQSKWGEVANGKRIKLDKDGIATSGGADKYFYVNASNDYGDT